MVNCLFLLAFGIPWLEPFFKKFTGVLTFYQRYAWLYSVSLYWLCLYLSLVFWLSFSVGHLTASSLIFLMAAGVHWRCLMFMKDGRFTVLTRLLSLWGGCCLIGLNYFGWQVADVVVIHKSIALTAGIVFSGAGMLTIAVLLRRYGLKAAVAPIGHMQYFSLENLLRWQSISICWGLGLLTFLLVSGLFVYGWQVVLVDPILLKKMLLTLCLWLSCVTWVLVRKYKGWQGDYSSVVISLIVLGVLLLYVISNWFWK